jgi:hypothetical protein
MILASVMFLMAIGFVLIFHVIPVIAIIGLAWEIGDGIDRKREAKRRSEEVEREAMTEMTSRSDD